MASSSASKTSRVSGAHPSKSPATQPFQHAAHPSSSSVHLSASDANTHLRRPAQLVPALVPAASGSEHPSYIGLSQPDPTTVTPQLPGQPYKDGRVRNPVPTKLKGKTASSSGRFSVMHMDLKSKELAADRDLAAKRTSENTALAAQKAFETGYQTHRRSNWVRVAEEPPDPAVLFTGTTPYNPALYSLNAASSPPKDPPREPSREPLREPLKEPPREPPREPSREPPREPSREPPKERQPAPYTPSPLFPDETKEHQARLLTLLRSLQPVQVVDQLCKALAYFGGIPDAPPPQDGKFPESAEANGSGAVFVGWLAEIFPDVDANGRPKPRPMRAPPPPPVEQTPQKRGRGRPKGSKATKSRSDKGVKKGIKGNAPTEAGGLVQEDSWVDIDDSRQDVVITGARPQPTPDSQAVMTGPEAITGSAKKRGRPKGSKNRPKDPTTGDYATNPPPISSLFDIKSAGHPVPRPKGQTKHAQAFNSTVAAHTNGATPVTTPAVQATMPQPAAAMEPQAQVDPGFTLAALKAFNEAHTPDIQTTHASSFQPVNNSPVAREPQATSVQSPAKSGSKVQPAKKRKWASKDSETIDQPTAGNTTAFVPVAGALMTQQPASEHQGASVMDSAEPAVPAPKRPRKTKPKPKPTTNSAPVVEPPTVRGASQASQAPAVSATPAVRPANSQMYASPTIEELEAQLDQHDSQNAPPSGANPMQGARQAQSFQPDLPRPLMQQAQAQQATKSKQTPKAAQQKTEQQRAMARQRQQYHQQQQHQQQGVVRTASPSVAQMGTNSPHMSVQSASPSISQTHAPSPNLHQQRASDSQTPTSVASQVQNQQPRNPQPYYQQQATSGQSPYGQSQQQYSSPQPAKQQFAVQQPQQQQNLSTPQQPAQQQQNYTNQQPQYSQQKQQPYSSQPPSQYASPQQRYSTQHRVQKQQQQPPPPPPPPQRPPPPYATTSTGTTSQTVLARSPQYGPSTASNYTSDDASFRTNPATPIHFNSPNYGSNQAPNTARNSNMYPSSTASTYGNQTQQVSSFTTAPRRPLPTTTAHQNPVQSVQGLPQNINSFSDFSNLNFDSNLMSSLDNQTTGHGNLGMSASYNMGTGNVSRPPAGANSFGFDSSLRNDGNSFYGLRR